MTNWYAMAVFLFALTQVRERRELLLLAIVAMSVFWPIDPDRDPESWYWILFCVEMGVGLLSAVINSPGSRNVCLVAVCLCMAHMAGATIIPIGITPDPYTIIVQLLESLLILSAITKRGSKWDGIQLRRHQ